MKLLLIVCIVSCSAGYACLSNAFSEVVDHKAFVAFTRHGCLACQDNGVDPEKHTIYPAMRILGEMDDGSIWASVQGQKLIRVKNEKKHIFTINNSLPDVNITAHSILNNTIWIGTKNGYIAKYLNGKWEILLSPMRVERDVGGINSIAISSQGELWAATTNSGVLKVGGDDILFYDQDSTTFKSNYITAMVISNDAKSLYVGTLAGGVKKYVDNKWVDISITPESNQHVPYVVSKIICNSDNTLWLGTHGGGVLYHGNKKNIQWNQNTTGLPINHIENMLLTKNNELWVVTSSSGPAVYRNNKWSMDWSVRGGISVERTMSICNDKDGSVWIANLRSGLVKYHNGKYVKFPKTLGGVLERGVCSVYADSTGVLWVGTVYGHLVRMHDNKWELYSDKYKE